MGGPGSTRWGMTLTRQTTEGLPQLDVRALARAGALVPGVAATVQWDESTQAFTHVTQAPPCRLVIWDAVRPNRGALPLVREVIHLDMTACTFGGTRPWFSCPGCGRRCAILYPVAGRFRCRVCQRLAYASTR